MDVWHNTAISEVFSGWNISAWAFWLLQAIRTFSSEISSKKNYSNKAQGGKGKIVSWGETNSPGGQHIRARGGSSAKNSLLQHSLSNSVTTNIDYPPVRLASPQHCLGNRDLTHRRHVTARARHQLHRSADPAD